MNINTILLVILIAALITVAVLMILGKPISIHFTKLMIARDETKPTTIQVVNPNTKEAKTVSPDELDKTLNPNSGEDIDLGGVLKNVADLMGVLPEKDTNKK